MGAAGEEISLKAGDTVFAKLPMAGGKLNKTLAGPYKVIKVTKSGAVVLISVDEKHGKTILLPITKLRKVEYDDDRIESNQLETDGQLEVNMEYNSKKKPKKTSPSALRRSSRKNRLLNYEQFY